MDSLILILREKLSKYPNGDQKKILDALDWAKSLHADQVRASGKTAHDGGFILSSGIVLDEGDPAAYRAFIEAGRKYGT